MIKKDHDISHIIQIIPAWQIYNILPNDTEVTVWNILILPGGVSMSTHEKLADVFCHNITPAKFKVDTMRKYILLFQQINGILDICNQWVLKRSFSSLKKQNCTCSLTKTFMQAKITWATILSDKNWKALRLEYGFTPFK